MINAFVALDLPVTVVPGDMLGWCQTHLPHRSWTVEPGKNGMGLTLASGGTNVMVIPIDKPLPWDKADEARSISPLWQGDRDRFLGHQAHWIVAIFGDDPPLTEARELSKFLTMLASEIGEVSAVGWGPSAMWMDRETFSSLANSSDQVERVTAWVAVLVGDHKGQLAGYSAGLDALGLMDIEVFGYPGEPGELMAWIYDMANYVVGREAVIKEGETVGQTEAEKFPIRHKRSQFDRNEKVMAVQCAPAKPWWKPWG